MIQEMTSFKCTILRGGTSKGIYMLENELPANQAMRERIILSIFGSPDVRQIDGLGGADPVTSKLAIVGPSNQQGADVDYTFGQVSIDEAKIYTKSICGNISSGVGPFAVNNNLVKVKEPVTEVKIYNTNTDKLLIAEVPVFGGKAAVDGEYAIDGVPGKGAKINLDFSRTVGALTGKLLPTGSASDIIDVEGLGDIRISIVDTGTCQVYVRAEDIGLEGTELPKDIDGNQEKLKLLERIRAKAAYMVGMTSSPEAATIESRNTPHLVFFTEPKTYLTHTDQTKIEASMIQLTARMMFMQIMHKAYAGTGSICTAVAAMIPGTVVNKIVKNTGDNTIQIGHPSGIIEVEVHVEKRDHGFQVRRAAIGRTARTIMEGRVMVKTSVLDKIAMY